MSELKTRFIDDTYLEYFKTGKHDLDQIYLKSEADKVIADKDKEIAELKTMTKEPSVPNRTCRKCGKVGTLMYMPIVKYGRIYWDLYNNKGIDYVFGIRCAHCGEVAFVTKQTHESKIRHQKYKRCLAMLEVAKLQRSKLTPKHAWWEVERARIKDERIKKLLKLAKKFKEVK